MDVRQRAFFVCDLLVDQIGSWNERKPCDTRIWRYSDCGAFIHTEDDCAFKMALAKCDFMRRISILEFYFMSKTAYMKYDFVQ